MQDLQLYNGVKTCVLLKTEFKSTGNSNNWSCLRMHKSLPVGSAEETSLFFLGGGGGEGFLFLIWTRIIDLYQL